MSMEYWMIEGVGVCVSDLRPCINADKFLNFLKEQRLDEPIPEDEDVESYIDDCIFDLDGIGSTFCLCDKTGALTYCDNGGGEDYLYYPPSMPWERDENEPKTLEEVHEILVNAIQCLTDLTKEQIENDFIDDNLYVYGCG